MTITTVYTENLTVPFLGEQGATDRYLCNNGYGSFCLQYGQERLWGNEAFAVFVGQMLLTEKALEWMTGAYAAGIIGPSALGACMINPIVCMRVADNGNQLANGDPGPSGLPAGVGASKVWNASTVEETVAANALERAFPGRVVDVNRNVNMLRGGYREIDVLLDGVYVQAKGGPGSGLATQIQNTLTTTGIPTVGFAPGIPNMAWEQAARQGIPIARTLDELIAIVREIRP